MDTYICIGEKKDPGEIFTKRFPVNKSVPFDAEFNSASNGLIMIDGNSFLYNSFLRGASFTSIISLTEIIGDKIKLLMKSINILLNYTDLLT